MYNFGLFLAEFWEPPDLPAARSWLEKAALAGHLGATFQLSVLAATQSDPSDLPADRGSTDTAADIEAAFTGERVDPPEDAAGAARDAGEDR